MRNPTIYLTDRPAAKVDARLFAAYFKKMGVKPQDGEVILIDARSGNMCGPYSREDGIYQAETFNRMINPFAFEDGPFLVYHAKRGYRIHLGYSNEEN